MDVNFALSSNDLTFREFQGASKRRCEEVFHPVEAWSPTDWACALGGEAGECLNEVKKLRRITDDLESALDHRVATAATIVSAQTRVANIADELADVVAYAALLATRLGIDLGEAVRKKFNEVSTKYNSQVTL